VHAESGRTGRIRLDQYFSVATQIPPADILKFRSLRVVAQRRVTKILAPCAARRPHTGARDLRDFDAALVCLVAQSLATVSLLTY